MAESEHRLWHNELSEDGMFIYEYPKAENKRAAHLKQWLAAPEETRVTFKIYMRDKYLFGISYTGDANTDKMLTEAIDGSGTSFSSGKDWAGFSEPSSRYILNFKNMDSEGIGKLKNPTSRAAFMNGLVNEIDVLIKKLVESFKKKGL